MKKNKLFTREFLYQLFNNILCLEDENDAHRMINGIQEVVDSIVKGYGLRSFEEYYKLNSFTFMVQLSDDKTSVFVACVFDDEEENDLTMEIKLLSFELFNDANYIEQIVY